MDLGRRSTLFHDTSRGMMNLELFYSIRWDYYYTNRSKRRKLQRITGVDNSTCNITKNDNAGNNLENLSMAETKEVLQDKGMKMIINFIDILV